MVLTNDQRGRFYPHPIQARGELQSGKLCIKELMVDAAAMQLFSHGEIDWVKQKIDFMVAVAPLKKVDWIVQRIPIADYILEGTLPLDPRAGPRGRE